MFLTGLRREIQSPLKLCMLCMVWLVSSLAAAHAKQSAQCELEAIVVPSQAFTVPTHQYTKLKNDGVPMIRLGIQIQAAKAIGNSVGITPQAKYCQALRGQKKDIYLSGQYAVIPMQNGDQIKLKHIHQAADLWPYWPDFYYLIDE